MKMCLHLFWQLKRPHMHKKLNNFRATINNESWADLQKNVKITTALDQEKIHGFIFSKKIHLYTLKQVK